MTEEIKRKRDSSYNNDVMSKRRQVGGREGFSARSSTRIRAARARLDREEARNILI